MKNTGKSIIMITDDDWSMMLEMLLGLNDIPYSYENLIDNH
jgi:hypothetical protein